MRFVLLEPFRLAEILLYHTRIKAHVPGQAPVFILGHWRSGTSYLQGLVCKDSRMTSNTIFRSLHADNFYLTEPWLKPLLNFICRVFKIPYSIQRVQMDLGLPAEADMSLCSLCSENSYTWGQLFPVSFDRWIDNTVLSNGSHSDAWISDYDYVIRKLSFRDGAKRVVVKSPGDTGRVAQLIRKYPDALFIYIHRDPYAVFHSSMYFWKILQRQVSLQKLTEGEIQDLIIRNYRKVMASYLEQRHLIPARQLAEVQFEALVKDPVGQLSAVYKKLDLGKLPAEVVNFAAAQRGEHKAGAYATSADLEHRLRREWAFAFEHLPV